MSGINFSKRIFLAVALLLSPGAGAATEGSQTLTVDEGSYDSPLSGALDFQYAPIRFPKYQWVGGATNPKGGDAFRLGFEWFAFPRLYGKLGLGFGTGFYQIKDVGVSPGVSTSLYAIPAEGYLTYRFDYVRNQIIVPFVKLGTSAVFTQQTFRPGTALPTYTYHGLDYGGGLEFCLNPIDYRASRDLDAATGINATYVVVEYARSQQLNGTGANRPNLSREEIRVGLRFEM